MEIKIHKDVKELLDELNEMGNALIFGGYIRDMIFNHKPNDVDIVTDISIEELQEKYGHLEKAKARVTTSGQNVFAFKMHRTEKIFVEIVSTKDDLYDKSRLADYTINSFLHDGEKLIDLQDGKKDLEDKIIREVDANIITHDLESRPYLWLKTLRLVSVTDFDLSDETFKVLDDNKECVKRISNEILQAEGHKTMNGINPFKAIKLLEKMGFVKPFDINGFNEIEYSIQTQQQLCLLAILSSKDTVDEFAKFYCFQQDIVDKYHKLYEFYYSDERVPSRFRNQIITIDKLVKKMMGE